MWDYCGMSRNCKEGLKMSAQGIKIQEVKQASFGKMSKLLGTNDELNMSLEKAGRVADFIELGSADGRRCFTS